MKKLPLLFAVALLCAAPARALDADDVAQLLQNGVNETVILNMVQSRPLTRPLSAQEVVSLQSLGASGSLLAQLTSPGAAVPQAAAPVYAAPAPTVVQQPVTVSQPVVVASPPVVYSTPYCPPTYVVPYRAPPRVTFSFGFGHGRDRGYRYYGRPSFRRYGGWSGRRW